MIADLAFEDVRDRCRACGKRLLLDVGQDVFGHVTGSMFCPNCDSTPQVSGWEIENIRACVAEIIHHNRPQRLTT